MNILLIGFLGAGKTSIGRLLADILHYSYVEMDDFVLEKSGHSSISEIYQTDFDKWKTVEKEVAQELCNKDSIVITATAAFVDDQENVSCFKENPQTYIIYLETNPEVLTQRLVELYPEFRKKGPNFVLKSMQKHYNKRKKLYAQYANYVFNTEDSTPLEATEEIYAKIKPLLSSNV